MLTQARALNAHATSPGPAWSPVPAPVHWSRYLVDLNRVPWTFDDCHVTPIGEPTVADLIKPGDLGRTSYGNTVYDVMAITAYNGHDDRRGNGFPPYFNLTGRDVSKPHGDNLGYLNELVAVQGRIRHLFKDRHDELFVVGRSLRKVQMGFDLG